MAIASLKRILFTLFVLCFAGLAQAQQAEVDLVAGRDAATPIAVVPFSGGSGAEMAAIIRRLSAAAEDGWFAAPAFRDPALMAKLDAVAGRVLRPLG